MPRPERRHPSPEELLAYADGTLDDGQRAPIAAALTASAASRERLRMGETGRLLRAGTPRWTMPRAGRASAPASAPSGRRAGGQTAPAAARWSGVIPVWRSP